MPISKRTGKRYAAGSTKSWGGWETRTCWTCQQRIVLARGTAIHVNPHGGQPFSLCQDHLTDYPAAWQANAPHEKPHPDQLDLTEALW